MLTQSKNNRTNVIKTETDFSKVQVAVTTALDPSISRRNTVIVPLPLTLIGLSGTRHVPGNMPASDSHSAATDDSCSVSLPAVDIMRDAVFTVSPNTSNVRPVVPMTAPKHGPQCTPIDHDVHARTTALGGGLRSEHARDDALCRRHHRKRRRSTALVVLPLDAGHAQHRRADGLDLAHVVAHELRLDRQQHVLQHLEALRALALDVQEHDARLRVVPQQLALRG
eukprot:PhM_4_TR2118/c1_g1_i8/m.57361